MNLAATPMLLTVPFCFYITHGCALKIVLVGKAKQTAAPLKKFAIIYTYFCVVVTDIRVVRTFILVIVSCSTSVLSCQLF